MKEKQLQVEWFLTAETLTLFVNNRPIPREDIQTIIHSEGRFYLYFWR